LSTEKEKKNHGRTINLVFLGVKNGESGLGFKRRGGWVRA